MFEFASTLHKEWLCGVDNMTKLDSAGPRPLQSPRSQAALTLWHRVIYVDIFIDVEV
jgi:hypothetical protein